MFDHLALPTKFLVNLSHVVVPILSHCDHVFVSYSTEWVGVLDAELGKTPLTAEIPWVENFQKTEHALRIVCLKVLGKDLCWLGYRTWNCCSCWVNWKLFFSQGFQWNIAAHMENMNCTFIWSATNILWDWIESKACNKWFIYTSAEFLNLCTVLCKEYSNNFSVCWCSCK
jgi:hypothetical protein